MKKLAVIAVIVAGLVAPVSVAQAKPTAGSPIVGQTKPGMSQAEYRALMLRSEALNRRYGLGAPVKRVYTIARGLNGPLVPSSQPSTDFQWGDAGIGASSALGLAVFAVGGAFVLRRQRGQLRAS